MLIIKESGIAAFLFQMPQISYKKSQISYRKITYIFGKLVIIIEVSFMTFEK